jgi:hypothetical protein
MKLWYKYKDVSELLGKTLTKVERGYADNDALYFHTDAGEIYMMTHHQDCCEDVGIEDIVGDLNDLVGSPITLAECSRNSEDPPANVGDDHYYEPESYTWTYYKFATIKGYVDIRWYGSSNGYYSETADFELIEDGKKD